MHAQKLIVFKHVGTDKDEKQKKEQAKLGCAPAHKLFEMVNVELINKDKPPRSFTDYSIVAPSQSDMPDGVTVEVKL